MLSVIVLRPLTPDAYGELWSGIHQEKAVCIAVVFFIQCTGHVSYYSRRNHGRRDW